jgi:lysozyme
MTDNTALLACVLPQIKREESCRLSAYYDSNGVPTIGWGRADRGVYIGMTCTQDEADEWLLNHVNDCIAGLDASLPWWRAMVIPRQTVLVEMVYQMGLGGLLAFHNALTAMHAGDWAAAKAQMLASKWAKQDSGARAQREAQQMFTGLVA